MIREVQFWPHPPAYFSELTRGASAELEALRAAVADAAALLTDCEALVAVGTGPVGGVASAQTTGTLAGFGEDLAVRFPALDEWPATGTTAPGHLERLPLSLLVAARVLADANVGLPTVALSVPAAGGPALTEVVRAIVRWADESDRRVGLLVLADGSAGRAANSPGYIIPGAVDYDDAAVAALASGSPAALADLDADLGVRVIAAGARLWPAVGSALVDACGDLRWSAGDVLAEDSLGVLYALARWQRS